MAARKRGKGGKFVSSGGAKKKAKKRRAPKESSSGSTPLALLHSIDRKVSRIDHKMSMPAKLRLARMRAGKASRDEEARLAAKYG